MHRVMIVDDEAVITTQLEERLTSMEYEVVGTASSGEEAVDIARHLRPDVILMDIVMPGKTDGIDASEIIKAELDIPVIFLTAYADDKFVKKAKNVEPFGYIVKPFQEREIKASIEVALYKKGIERQLRETRDYLDNLLQYANAPIIVWDTKQRITLFNTALERLTRYKAREVLGQPFSMLFPKASRDESLAKIRQTSSGEYWESVEIPILRKDGGIRIVLWNSANIYDKDSKTLIATIAQGQDITERKQAEEALRESEEKYRTLFQDSKDAIFITTRDGELIDANQAYLELFGYAREEALGMDVRQMYANPEDRLRYQQEMEQKGAVKDFELKLRKKGRTELDCLLTATVRQTKDGGVLGYQGIIRDITERKKLEGEFQRIEKLEAIGALAGGIAHDFNNLLTGIMGNIGLAKSYVEPKSQAEERLLEAEKASLRAKDLTQQLLTFARGGAPIKKIVSIAELIRDSATFALRGSNVRCEFSLPDDLWSAEVDEGQINQVIANMVINADEAMPEGGVLNIGAKNTVIKGKEALPLPTGNYVEITIEDHGVGISKEHLQRIFDPYFTAKQKGSGLGLTTAYSIIKNHNGHITVESELGVGTTFHIYLPASKKPVPKKEKVEAPAIGKGRILVMDDEEIIRLFLSRLLSGAGYEVELTEDGAEAIEQFTKAKESGQPFDAVILDLTIPGGMGGKEVIKKLLEIDPNVKSIVSSGYSTDPIMADCKKYGFSGVVAKPYSVGELEKTLHSILQKK